MTLREKIGQLFIIRPESLDPDYSLSKVHYSSVDGSLQINEKMEATYKEYPAGGIILFGRNITSPEQIKNFTQQIHNLSPIKCVTCIDEEGGLVARLAKTPGFNLPKFKDMKSIGDTKDPAVANHAGVTIGTYLNDYGFDIDFAPIADVNTNPRNPIIGNRAFSSNPQIAGEMVIEFSKGLESKNVIPCLKHFPGHGDTQTDSHSGYAETLKNWEQLLNCEMIPFKMGIDADIPLIMTAHITAPNVDTEKLPSTLSNFILTEKLRNELGFTGVIITDAMEMGAITRHYTPEQAVIKAIQAGADIVLIPFDYKSCFDAVVHAVEEGTISMERIDESVKRILSMKYKYENSEN